MEDNQNDQNENLGTIYKQQGISNTLRSQAAKIKSLGKNAKWTDDLFTADEASIASSVAEESSLLKKPSAAFIKKVAKGNTQLDLKQSIGDFTWLRITEVYNLKDLNILKEPKEIKENPEILAEDVVQGGLGDCYFLSSIAALAETPTKIKKLFKSLTFNNQGYFEVVVYLHGEPISVFVDDYFVFRQENKDNPDEKPVYTLAFSKINPKTNNIWPIILEKVWAKLNGSFESINKGACTDVFEVFSPAPFITYYHNVHQDIVFDAIRHAKKKGYIVNCDISAPNSSSQLSKLKEIGLISNHSYKVLETAEITGIKGDKTQLLKIKNPWGTNEWEGDWSDKSKKWTEEIKELLNFEDKEDGIFWISLNDFLKFYTSTHILNEGDGYFYEIVKSPFNKGQEFNLFKVNIPKKGACSFIVNQKNSRIYQKLLVEEGFQNHYGSMIVYKWDGEIVTALGSDSGKKNRMFVEIDELEKGEYFIAVNFPSKHPEIVKLGVTEEFNTHLNAETFNILAGAYSSVSGVSLTDIAEDNNDFKHFFLEYIRSASQALDNNYYFEDEGEKESYRTTFFDQKSAYGYIFYENKSEGFIKEILTFTELSNINVYPILTPGKLVSLQKLLETIEDPEELKHLQILQSKINLESTIEVLGKPKSNEKITAKTPVEIKVTIAPNTCGVVLLEKSDEQAEVDFESKLVVTYPLHTILNDTNKFSSVTTKIKYMNKLVDIYETIIEHNNGVLIRYRNRSKNLVLGSHIKFNELKNLQISQSSDELIAEAQVQKTTEGNEEASLGEDPNQASRLVTEDNFNGLNEFNIEINNPSKESAVIVEPDDIKFIQLKAINEFEVYSYSYESSFFINISKKIK